MRIVYLVATFLLCATLESCKKNSIFEPQEQEVDRWPKDSVMRVVEWGMWRIQKVFLVNNGDTADLAKTNFSSGNFDIRHEIALAFSHNSVPVWSLGAPVPDEENKFRKTADIHYFTERAIRSSDLSYTWNDYLNTLQITSVLPGLLQLPVGYTAHLIKSRIVVYSSYQEEEKATRPSCLMFRVDSPSGIYLFELRRVWKFENDPIFTQYARYVVFP